MPEPEGTLRPEVNILFVLSPTASSLPNTMVKKISEFPFIDKKFNLFVLTGLSKYTAAEIERLKGIHGLSFDLYQLPVLGSLKGALIHVLYWFESIYFGAKIVKEKKIDLLICPDDHVRIGSVSYLISRLTHRKCILRVSADFLIPLICFLRRTKNPIFSRTFVANVTGLVFRRLESFFLKHADRIVTPGPMDFEKIKQITPNVSLVPLWVNLGEFKPLNKSTVQEFKHHLISGNLSSLKKNSKILLFVGRLHPEKDIKTLIEMFKIVSEEEDDVLLVIVGDGDYRQEYVALAEQLELSEKIIFKGWVPHNEMPYYYNVADVYILCSWREEWSNTIMEAMGCKTPVIATNVGGNRYLVNDGVTGFLVPSRDPKKLAEKVKYVLANNSLASQVTEKALERMRDYRKENIAGMYEDIVRKLVKS